VNPSSADSLAALPTQAEDTPPQQAAAAIEEPPPTEPVVEAPSTVSPAAPPHPQSAATSIEEPSITDPVSDTPPTEEPHPQLAAARLKGRVSRTRSVRPLPPRSLTHN